MKVTAINKGSGEQIELPADTPEDIVNAYRIAAEYEKVAKSLKDQLKKLLPNVLDEQGRSPEVNGYIIKRYESQRMNYNPMALYNVFDEDTVNLFMKPQKGLVDKYLKENQLDPDQLAELKRGLEPDGPVINSVRLERL